MKEITVTLLNHDLREPLLPHIPYNKEPFAYYKGLRDCKLHTSITEPHVIHAMSPGVDSTAQLICLLYSGVKHIHLVYMLPQYLNVNKHAKELRALPRVLGAIARDHHEQLDKVTITSTVVVLDKLSAIELDNHHRKCLFACLCAVINEHTTALSFGGCDGEYGGGDIATTLLRRHTQLPIIS